MMKCVVLLFWSVLVLLVCCGELKADVAQYSSSLNLFNVYLTWTRYSTNASDLTNYTVTTTFGGAGSISPTNAWLGICLNNINEMDNGEFIICQNVASQTSVKHFYYVPGTPMLTLFNSTQPSYGLYNGVVSVAGSNLTCSFTRDNSFNAQNITLMQAYVLVAYGSGSLAYHGSNRAVSDNTVAINAWNASATTTSTTTKSTTLTTTTKSLASSSNGAFWTTLLMAGAGTICALLSLF